MKELSIEQRLVDSVKRLGGVAVKGENVAGFPDRIVLMPGGHVYFVEVKRPSGRLSGRQVEWVNDLQALDMEVWIVADEGMLNSFLAKVRIDNATA
jgi:hypothetical protein